MQTFLGVDIGGTNIKMGFVNSDGELLTKSKVPTIDLRKSGDFSGELFKLISEQLASKPEVLKVGLGVPGLVSKDCKSLLELPNIPELSHFPLVDELKKKFPNHTFTMGNDANAAALGEYHFGKDKIKQDLLFITLGTGIGSAAIIDGKIFIGGDGNGMELGHIMYKNGRTLENRIGKKGIMQIIAKELKKSGSKSAFFQGKEIATTKEVLAAAREGDKSAIKIYAKVGEILGIGLIAAVRILDIKNIVIGGGVSEVFDFIEPEITKAFQAHLTPYYNNSINVKLASLGNEAGIIGAASLCFLS
jgi:glucokinase